MATSRTKSQKTLVSSDVLWEEVERVERVEQVERPHHDAYYVPQLNTPLREVQLSPPSASSFTFDPSIWDKLGSYGIIILGVSIIGLLSSAGFISFLWCAGDSNYIWRLLASNEGMTKAVAISSMVFRTSITLQAGVATSMLAGLAIERKEILLPQLATVSMMRSSNSGPIVLAWLLRPRPGKKGGIRGLLVPGLATLLALTTLSSQFISTALLSDISSGLVTGPTQYILAQIPGGKGSIYRSEPAGLQPGYGAVMIVFLIHVILMIVIMVLFFLQTSISTIGNSWQNITQAIDPDTLKYLSRASLVSDSQIKTWISDDGLVAQVGVSLKPNGKGTEMTWRNHSSRSNSMPTIKLERASNLETENDHDYRFARESALSSLVPPSPATSIQSTPRQSAMSSLQPLTPTSLRQSTSSSSIRPSRPARPEPLSLGVPRENTLSLPPLARSPSPKQSRSRGSALPSSAPARQATFRLSVTNECASPSLSPSKAVSRNSSGENNLSVPLPLSSRSVKQSTSRESAVSSMASCESAPSSPSVLRESALSAPSPSKSTSLKHTTSRESTFSSFPPFQTLSQPASGETVLSAPPPPTIPIRSTSLKQSLSQESILTPLPPFRTLSRGTSIKYNLSPIAPTRPLRRSASQESILTPLPQPFMSRSLPSSPLPFSRRATLSNSTMSSQISKSNRHSAQLPIGSKSLKGLSRSLSAREIVLSELGSGGLTVQRRNSTRNVRRLRLSMTGDNLARRSASDQGQRSPYETQCWI